MSLSASCQEENLSLQVVKTSILNEETRRKGQSVLSQSEANVAKNIGRGRSKHRRSLQNRDKSHARSKSRGRLTCCYCGKTGHFQKNCRRLNKDKGIAGDVEPRNIYDEKNTSAIAASEEELLFISKQARVNLVNDECSWVVDSSASFHLTVTRECFSSYSFGDYGYVKMGNDGACEIVGIGSVCLLTSIGCSLVG